MKIKSSFKEIRRVKCCPWVVLLFLFLFSIVVVPKTALGTMITIGAAPPVPGPVVNEAPNIIVGILPGGGAGGMTQISSRVTTIEGPTSDLILSNFRLRLDVPGSTYTKPISANNYLQPAPIAGSAWHRISASATLLGPMGSFAQIDLTLGTLDGQDTLTGHGNAGAGGNTILRWRVTKNGPGLVYSGSVASTLHNMNPPTPPLHTRAATYGFSFGGGALANSEIRMTNSGENPFVVPEPSTLLLFGIGALGFIGYGWRRWKKNRKEK